MTATCATSGCGKPQTSGRWCAACRKRQQRQRQGERAAEREASLALVIAAEDLVDEIAAAQELQVAAKALDEVPTSTDGDVVFEAAQRRLERAAEALCLARGWTPPPGVQVGQRPLATVAGDRRSSNG